MYLLFHIFCAPPQHIPLEKREESWSWLHQLPQKYALYSILLPPIPHSYSFLKFLLTFYLTVQLIKNAVLLMYRCTTN